MKTTRRARTIKSTTIFQGRVFGVKVEEVVEPGGVRVRREIATHGGSVGVLPILPDGRILLVRQYRHAVKKAIWEVVAGGIESGESPRQAARRELIEEAGFDARRLRPIVDFYPTPGFLTERMYLIEARDLTPAPARPEADERIEVRSFTPSQLRRMLAKNQIVDGKTLVALLWFFNRRVETAEDRP